MAIEGFEAGADGDPITTANTNFDYIEGSGIFVASPVHTGLRAGTGEIGAPVGVSVVWGEASFLGSATSTPVSEGGVLECWYRIDGEGMPPEGILGGGAAVGFGPLELFTVATVGFDYLGDLAILNGFDEAASIPSAPYRGQWLRFQIISPVSGLAVGTIYDADGTVLLTGPTSVSGPPLYVGAAAVNSPGDDFATYIDDVSWTSAPVIEGASDGVRRSFNPTR